jgi:hypothetical protein
MGSYTWWQTHSEGGDARDAGVDIKAKRTADGANKPMYLIKLSSEWCEQGAWLPLYRLSRRPRQSSSTGVHRATSVPPAFVSSLQQPDDSGLVRRTVPPPTNDKLHSIPFLREVNTPADPQLVCDFFMVEGGWMEARPVAATAPTAATPQVPRPASCLPSRLLARSCLPPHTGCGDACVSCQL